MANLSGLSLGRYQLLDLLGEGGMAVVYKAYDTRLECNCAVKIIRTENLPRNTEERARKRFVREAKLLAKLTHPNIVKVTDFGEYNGNPYLVMPYLPGGTLKQLIKQRGQIPWAEAIQLLIPITAALWHAHENKIIHRDVKPSNILFAQDSIPMLTDFGVAKIVEDEATLDLTGTSATLGTPEYMAPEQITSKTVDQRADLYAIGVVFYEMITGRRPFEADTPMAVMVKQAHDPLPRPSHLVKNLPDRVEKFLLKALAKKPEDRYQTAAEMEKAFQFLLPIKKVEVEIKPKKEKSTPKIVIRLTDKPLSQKHKPLSSIIIAVGSMAVVALGIYLIITRFANAKPSLPNKAATTIPTFVLPTPTVIIKSTFTPEPSPTITSVPVSTITASAPLETIPGSLTKNLKCRKGPSEFLYPYDGTINLQPVGIIGKNTDGTWINFISSIENNTCWTRKEYVKSASSLDGLPVVPDPVVSGDIYFAVVKLFCWNDGVGWTTAKVCSHHPACYVEKTTEITSAEAIYAAKSALAGTTDQPFHLVWGAIPYSEEAEWDYGNYPCPMYFDGTLYHILD